MLSFEQVNEWLGQWGPSFAGKHERVELTPAPDAVGYQWYPQMPAPLSKEKADFSRGPQMAWWLKDNKKSRKSGAIARGIKQVLRSINVGIIS